MSTAPVFVSARSDCCGVGIFLRLDVEAVLACLPVGSLCVQWWCVIQQPLRWTPSVGQSRGRIKRECLRTSSDAGVPEWRPGRYRSGEPEPPLSGLLPLPAVVTQTPLYMTVTHPSFPHCASPPHKGIGVNGAGKAGHWGGGIQDRGRSTGIGVGIIWTLRSQGHNLMGELWN